MLEHHHPVAGGKRNSAPRAAFANNRRNHRRWQFQARPDGAGNGLGLASFLGTAAGIGPGGVDKTKHRQPKPSGQLHQPAGLAIAFRARHPKIALYAVFGRAALFSSHHHNSLPAKPGHTTDNGMILGKIAVTGQRREIVKQPVKNRPHFGPVRMPCNLHFFPSAKLFIGLFEFAFDPGLKLANLVSNIDAAIGAHMAQFFNLAFKAGNRLFKIQKLSHITLSV